MLKNIKNTLSRHFSARPAVQHPAIYDEFILYAEINLGNLSRSEIGHTLSWCFSLPSPSAQQLQFLAAFAEALAQHDYSKEAYQLSRLSAYWQPNSPPSPSIAHLEQRVLENIKIGIAVITFNRLKRLQQSIEAIKQFNGPNIELVVADDGSQDETVTWCRDNVIPCITAANSGVVANKNRALYYLHELKQCDVSILLEDDCYPVQDNWHQQWALSALVWGHINFAHQRILGQTDKLLSGSGSISDPYLSQLVTGQCTATSRSALEKVGYLNPSFKGYGCGHVEWTERFLAFGYHPHTRLSEAPLFACINAGIFSLDAPTFKDSVDLERNRAIKRELTKRIKTYQPPWQSEAERLTFIDIIRDTAQSHHPIEPQKKVLTRLEQDGNFFFVHLSKTAGTSFRTAIEAHYPVWKDYGNKVSHTSEQIQHLLYDAQDSYPLKKEFQDQSNTWITGHVPLAKYSDLVSTRSIITFVREPISQIISHYNHFVTHHKFKGNLDEFLKRPSILNFQSKHLGALPLGLIGYIGLTENYTQSVALINDYYQLKIDVQHVNKNPKRSLDEEALLAQQLSQLRALNANDLTLYQHATWLYQQRKRLTEQGKEWVYSHVEINRQSVLTGCAYFAYSDQPVTLLVYKNGEPLLETCAQHFYHAYSKFNFPRKRYIGIQVPLKDQIEMGDQIELFVESTGQQLTITPLTAFAPKK
jgi:glycosyltransferase involved in cell wall biosynthesis